MIVIFFMFLKYFFCIENNIKPKTANITYIESIKYDTFNGKI